MVNLIDPTPRRSGSAAVWLPLLVVLLRVYGLTGSKLYFGYEGANIFQAEAFARGQLQPREDGGIAPWTQGGLLEVAVYLPFTYAKLFFERREMLLGLRQLAYVMVMPLLTVALCGVFYGLARRLYESARTAAVLTLVLGLTTMIWPYAKFGMEVQQTFWTL